MSRPGDALITRLLEVISGDAPMADAARLLAPDVVCHMDQYTVRGIDVWLDWLEFLRSHAGGAVRVDLDRFVEHPDGTISAYGWLRVANAKERTPQQNDARYRIENERIAEIWTTRGNYEMIFGAKARYRMSWLLVLLQMSVWRRRPWRERTHPSHRRGGLVDRGRTEPLSGGETDDHPER